MVAARQFEDLKIDEAQLSELCRRYYVRELSVFGSAARGEMRPDSDVDLLVEFLPGAKVDLFDHECCGSRLPRILATESSSSPSK